MPSVATTDQGEGRVDMLTPEDVALRDLVVTSFRGEALESSPCHQWVRLDDRRLRERNKVRDDSLQGAERLAESPGDAGRQDRDMLHLVQWLAEQYALRTLEARLDLAAAFALDRRPSLTEQRRLIAVLRDYQSKALHYLARGAQREFRRWQENTYLLGLHFYYAGQVDAARRAWLALLEGDEAPPPGRWLNLYAHLALGQSYLQKPVTDASRLQALSHFREAYSALASSQAHQHAAAAAGCYVAELEAATGDLDEALVVLRKLKALPSRVAPGVSAYAERRAEELRAGNGGELRE